MILMCVRNQNSFHIAIGNCLEKRQRIVAGILRMHSAIQHEPVALNLKIVRIRADLGVSGKVNEFQMRFPSAS